MSLRDKVREYEKQLGNEAAKVLRATTTQKAFVAAKDAVNKFLKANPSQRKEAVQDSEE